MRIASASMVLALGLLALGCDKAGPASSSAPADSGASPTPNTSAPIVQDLVKPITQELNKGVAATQEQIDLAKAQVAKYQAQVADYTKQLTGLNGMLDEAKKALADIQAKAQAQVAPLQAQWDEIQKQIKSLEALAPKASRTVKYPVARAGFDVGGLLGGGADKLAALKTQADGIQKQIDGILGQAKTAGLPYTDKIASLTDSIKTVTASLDKAQGLLGAAQTNLASLTAPAAK